MSRGMPVPGGDEERSQAPLFAAVGAILACVGGYFLYVYFWGVIPSGFVGKWEAVQGSVAGTRFVFHRSGELEGEQNGGGRRGTVKSQVSVSGNKVRFTSVNPVNQKTVVTTQTLKSLTEDEMILDDGQGEHVLRRVR